MFGVEEHVLCTTNVPALHDEDAPLGSKSRKLLYGTDGYRRKMRGREREKEKGGGAKTLGACAWPDKS
jgi:hypothetical protein